MKKTVVTWKDGSRRIEIGGEKTKKGRGGGGAEVEEREKEREWKGTKGFGERERKGVTRLDSTQRVEFVRKRKRARKPDERFRKFPAVGSVPLEALFPSSTSFNPLLFFPFI
ncbi:hypothetical protein SCA6_010107 [Theobroma cacao]